MMTAQYNSSGKAPSVVLRRTPNARRPKTLASALRLALGLLAAVVVWMCAGLQVVFAQPLRATEPVCGTGLFMFLLITVFCWGVTSFVLSIDCVRMYRGSLSSVFGWVRTLPAAVAVLLTPALLLVR